MTLLNTPIEGEVVAPAETSPGLTPLNNTPLPLRPSVIERDLNIDNKLIIEISPDGTRRLFSDLPDPDAANRELLASLGRLPTGGAGGIAGSPPASKVQAVVAAFIDDKKQSGQWGDANTLQNRTYRCEQIRDFLGAERRWCDLTRDDAKNYRSHLLQCLASHYGRASDEKSMSPSTAKAYFQLFCGLAAYAHAEGHHASDITRKLDFKAPADTQSYASFTPDDIHKIFHAPIYTNHETKRSREMLAAYFWLPLLGAHTGARLNELCQLTVDDIGCLEDIWYLSIQEDELRSPGERKKSLKTEASRRTTPLHPVLIQAGFLAFVEERKRALATSPSTDRQLFDGLTWDKKNRWGKKAGRWHNESFLEELALDAPAHKCFHSYRHTVVQHLFSQHDLSDDKIAAVVGHEGKSTTSKYGRDINITTLRWLQSKVNLIDYGVSTTHISYERFKEYQVCKGRPLKNAHLLRAYQKRLSRAA